MAISHTQALAAVRSLLYSVQFEQNPSNHVDRVARQIRQDRIAGIGAGAAIKLIEDVLSTGFDLSTALPSGHLDLEIRDYLRRLRLALSTEADHPA